MPMEHPRSRGENFLLVRALFEIAGTSPLTRGKLVGVVQDEDLARNIPAHAGKTKTTEGDFELAKEHPRSRGENPLEE